jgi:hypothetical protein
MHIQNVHFHFGGAFGAAILAGLAGFEAPSAAAPNTAAAEVKVVPPKIGEAWPGIEGSVYAGISRGEDGAPDGHLVLLAAQPDRDMSWQDALAWAEGLGDGARLPTRFESALLYANVRDHVDQTRWHWTSTQYSSVNAWYQGFLNGLQYYFGKKFEARARAVRRLIL